MEEWKTGNPFEKRAVAAGLCEPGILKEKWFMKRVQKAIGISRLHFGRVFGRG
jgi:hypothetical protein